MEHRRQKNPLLAARATKSANPYFIVYYSFTVVPMIGTSGADNWQLMLWGVTGSGHRNMVLRAVSTLAFPLILSHEANQNGNLLVVFYCLHNSWHCVHITLAKKKSSS